MGSINFSDMKNMEFKSYDMIIHECVKRMENNGNNQNDEGIEYNG